MPRTQDLDDQRFLNNLRAAIGLGPLYPLPLAPGALVVVMDGREPNFRFRPGRVLKNARRSGFWLVDLDNYGPEELHHEKIRLLSRL